jgi:hypothetical protein
MSEPKIGESRRGNAGKGRVKGSKNKITATVKEAILIAFNDVGNSDYLVQMAHKQPVAFMSLLGKVLPQDVNANIVANLLPGSIDDFLVPRED